MGAIEESDSVAKAWFRRGEAQLALNDCESAKADFEKTFQLDPENKAAKNKIVQCQQRIKAQKEKEKRTFANMFDKFAMADKKKEDLEKKRMPDAMNHINQWNSGGEKGINTDPNSIKVEEITITDQVAAERAKAAEDTAKALAEKEAAEAIAAAKSDAARRKAAKEIEAAAAAAEILAKAAIATEEAAKLKAVEAAD